MFDDELPLYPPTGKKRYKAICRDTKDNPFRGNGVRCKVQKVDIDSTIPFSQVEQWARDAAKKAGLEFIELKVVSG